MNRAARRPLPKPHPQPIGSLIGVLWLCLAQMAQAQSPPGTDIHLLSLRGDLAQAVPLNITARPGYDNQPAFSADGSALYYTRFVTVGAPGGQTEIYRYRLADQHTDRITRTPFSEYSPTPKPAEQSLSVIRVEPPDNRQRLWALPLDRNQPDRVIFKQVEPVGYHAWADQTTAAMFILGEPFTLAVNLSDGRPRTVAHNIGRGIEAWQHGDERILFIDRSDAEQGWIAALNPDTGEHRRLRPTLPGSEDFAVDHRGRLWMASDSRLYRASVSGDGDWQLMVDLAPHGLTAITRIAVDPDATHLALVSDELADTPPDTP